MSRGVLALVLATVAVSSALEAAVPYLVLFGTCQELLTPADFEASRFTDGKWYEIARYDNAFEEGASCVTLTYFVEQGGANWNILFSFVNQEGAPDQMIGEATFARNESHIAMSARFPGDTHWASYEVLRTDYVNYAVVYSCWQHPVDPSLPEKQERFWILGRQPSLSEETQQAVERALNGTSLGLYLTTTNQTCSMSDSTRGQ